jgi:hypothetical protein
MECDCFEKFIRYEFDACCPEHQVAVNIMRKRLEEAIRQALVKTLLQVADDEVTLSAQVIE